MGTKPLSPNALVKVASCWDVPRADLVRMALAGEDIPAVLGNAGFLSWYWHYGNAVGGATIYVRHSQFEQARRVLVAARSKIANILPPWTCSSCGERVAGQWDACWQCGQWADGTPSPLLAESATSQPAGGAKTVPWWNVPRFVAVVATIGLMILMLKYGLIPPLMLAPFVFFFVLLLWRFEPSRDRQPEPQIAAEPDKLSTHDFRATQSELSRAIVRRAWQSAVLAILFFPPLGFYSMRLLWKLGNRNTPLGRADTWRLWTAFFLNVPAILFCLAFVWALLSAILSVFV